MPAIACQRYPGQDVRLNFVGGAWLPEGDSLCFQCAVLRTETHDAALSPMTCVPFKLLEVLPEQAAMETWIEMPAPEVVPVPEPGGLSMILAGVVMLTLMKGRWRG